MPWEHRKPLCAAVYGLRKVQLQSLSRRGNFDSATLPMVSLRPGRGGEKGLAGA